MLPLLAVLVLLSWLVGLCGRKRRFGFWGYFFASLLLTPVVGALLVIASGPPAAQPNGGKA